MMAVATLNTSVDVPDNLLYKHLAKGKSATVNEVESVVEFIAEFVLDTDFQFDEKRGDDSNSNNLAKKISPLKFNHDKPEFSLFNSITKVEKTFALETLSHVSGFVKEITPPPPKA